MTEAHNEPLSTHSDEEYAFPVLQPVLEAYYPGPGRRVDEGGDARLLEDYAREGEDSARFEGLMDDLRSAIRRPKAAAAMVNAVLGLEGEDAVDGVQARELLADLADRLRAGDSGTGDGEDADADEAGEKPPASRDSVAVLQYVVLRKVALPVPWFRDHPLPMWVFLGSGFAIGTVGLLLGRLPLPGPLAWIPALLSLLGLVLMAAAALTMKGLEDDITKPEKAAKRAERRAEQDAKREDARERRSRLFRNIAS